MSKEGNEQKRLPEFEKREHIPLRESNTETEEKSKNVIFLQLKSRIFPSILKY